MYGVCLAKIAVDIGFEYSFYSREKNIYII